MPLARISLTLPRHISLSFIASGRSSGLHPVSSHSCWMYVRDGRPAFSRPYVGLHRSTSLMSSSLLLQQCPACLVRVTWIVFVMGGSFFQAAVVSILLYGCTTWTLTKRLEKKLDGNYTRMLRAILTKSWRQYPRWHQLYGYIYIYIYSLWWWLAATNGHIGRGVIGGCWPETPWSRKNETNFSRAARTDMEQSKRKRGKNSWEGNAWSSARKMDNEEETW